MGRRVIPAVVSDLAEVQPRHGAVASADADTDGVLRLARSWPRGPDHLLLDYVRPDGHHVAGQWFGARSRPHPPPVLRAADADRARLERVRSATAAVARRHDDVVALPDRGLLLQAGGADRRLPTLARALAEPGARLVSHRAERRAVVRVETAGIRRYLKLVRPGRTDRVARDLGTAAVAIATPRVLAVDSGTGRIVLDALPGRPWHDVLLEDDTARLDAIAAACGALVRRLHDTRPPEGTALHDDRAEFDVVAGWGRRLGDLLGSDPIGPHLPTLRDRLDRTADNGSDTGRVAPLVAVLHRDLHDKQFIVAGDGRVALLDLDTMATGDPALDVANLLVHLELRALQGRMSVDRAERSAAAFLEGYGFPTPSGPSLGRLRAHAMAARLRLAAVYAFRPGRPELPGVLLERADEPPPGTT